MLCTLLRKCAVQHTHIQPLQVFCLPPLGFWNDEGVTELIRYQGTEYVPCTAVTMSTNMGASIVPYLTATIKRFYGENWPKAPPRVPSAPTRTIKLWREQGQGQAWSRWADQSQRLCLIFPQKTQLSSAVGQCFVQLSWMFSKVLRTSCPSHLNALEPRSIPCSKSISYPARVRIIINQHGKAIRYFFNKYSNWFDEFDCQFQEHTKPTRNIWSTRRRVEPSLTNRVVCPSSAMTSLTPGPRG